MVFRKIRSHFGVKKQTNKKQHGIMHTLGHTICASLSIAVDHARITLYPSYCGWFQHDNILQTSDHLNLVS